MGARISFEGAAPVPFELKSGVKQGRVLAPTLHGIFSAGLCHVCLDNDKNKVLRTNTDDRLCKILQDYLPCKRKLGTFWHVNHALFTDADAFVSRIESGLQYLMDVFLALVGFFYGHSQK